MNETTSNFLIEKFDKSIDDLETIKEEIHDSNSFETDPLKEDFLDNLENAIVYLEECIANLESDEAVFLLKTQSKN